MNTSKGMNGSLLFLLMGFTSLTLCFSFRLVEETLKPLDPDRRAYRLVGGVLVERTVKEVLPSVANNRENVSVKWIVEFILMKYILFPSDFVLCHIHAAGKGYCHITRAIGG